MKQGIEAENAEPLCTPRQDGSKEEVTFALGSHQTYWKSVTMLIHVDKNEKRKEKKKPRTPTLSQMSITCVCEETPTIYVKGSL